MARFPILLINNFIYLTLSDLNYTSYLIIAVILKRPLVNCINLTKKWFKIKIDIQLMILIFSLSLILLFEYNILKWMLLSKD